MWAVVTSYSFLLLLVLFLFNVMLLNTWVAPSCTVSCAAEPPAETKLATMTMLFIRTILFCPHSCWTMFILMIVNVVPVADMQTNDKDESRPLEDPGLHSPRPYPLLYSPLKALESFVLPQKWPALVAFQLSPVLFMFAVYCINDRTSSQASHVMYKPEIKQCWCDAQPVGCLSLFLSFTLGMVTLSWCPWIDASVWVFCLHDSYFVWACMCAVGEFSLLCVSESRLLCLGPSPNSAFFSPLCLLICFPSSLSVCVCVCEKDNQSLYECDWGCSCRGRHLHPTLPPPASPTLCVCHTLFQMHSLSFSLSFLSLALSTHSLTPAASPASHPM